jgi:hypothetical protein
MLVLKHLILLLVIIFVGLYFPFYVQTEIYNFGQSEPFSGDSFYNPYQKWQSDKPQKANFHAHSKAWFGITNGGNSVSEVATAYKLKGYELACLSNYQSISNRSVREGFLPVYEHGFNVMKVHQLAVGADAVSFLDFPFFQCLSQKQLVINRIKEHSKFVALAHPALRNGYTENDLVYLSNYDFMEVLSPFANSLTLWDTALRHGKRVWCMANDDLHQISSQSLGRYYNVMSSEAINRASTEKLMEEGCFYAVHDKSGTCNLSLENLKINGEIINFDFNGEVAKVSAISDKGVFVDFNSDKGTILFPANESYVRLEVTDVEGNMLITNPVIRSGVKEVAVSNFVINDFHTMLYRMAVLGLTLLILLLCFSNITTRVNFEIKDIICKLSLAYT